jgi:hypothetical protein
VNDKEKAWLLYEQARNAAPTGSREHDLIILAGPASFMPGNFTGYAAARGDIDLNDLVMRPPDWRSYWDAESDGE